MASETAKHKRKRKEIESSHEICRLCMSTESLEDVFEVEGLRQWISDYLSILISSADKLSHTICTICRIQLAEFHQFRMRCEEVQATLLSMGPTEEGEGEEEEEEMVETPKVVSPPRCIVSRRRGDPIKGVLEMGDQYHCGTCWKVFDERRKIKDHMRTHGPKKYVCEHCGKAYPLRRYLVVHMKCHSTQLEQESIDEKNQNVYDRQAIKVEPREEVDLPAELQSLKDGTDTEGTIDSANDRIEIEHVKLEKPSDDDDTETDSAVSKSGGFEPYAEERDLHSECHLDNVKTVLDKSKDRIKTEMEEVCEDLKDDVNDSRVSVQQEKKTKNPQEEQLYTCDKCSKAFTTKQKIRDHLRLVHGEKKHKCSFCGKGFVLTSQLRLHERMHTRGNDRSKQCTCSICDKIFKSGKALWHHKNTEHSVQQYPCSDCRIQFVTRRQLEKHQLSQFHRMTLEMKEHIKSRDTEAVLEKLCLNSTKHSRKSQNRRDKLVNIEHLRTDEGVYQCDVCPKQFSERQQIKDHKRLVHGERKLACDICDKRYVIPSQLWKHVRTHNKGYMCEVCKKSFHHERTLWSHKRGQHNLKE
nr:zinc finger protein 62 [Aedes albopictus]